MPSGMNAESRPNLYKIKETKTMHNRDTAAALIVAAILAAPFVLYFWSMQP